MGSDGDQVSDLGHFFSAPVLSSGNGNDENTYLQGED